MEEEDRTAGRGRGTVEEYGRCSVSVKLEAALRKKAGDYMANRLLRDYRLPRQEMPEDERKRVLLEFIEAMTEYLGKEDAREILVEVGREARLPPSAAARARSGALAGGASR
jgi:hypothetical protein